MHIEILISHSILRLNTKYQSRHTFGLCSFFFFFFGFWFVMIIGFGISRGAIHSFYKCLRKTTFLCWWICLKIITSNQFRIVSSLLRLFVIVVFYYYFDLAAFKVHSRANWLSLFVSSLLCLSVFSSFNSIQASAFRPGLIQSKSKIYIHKNNYVSFGSSLRFGAIWRLNRLGDAQTN